MLKKKRFISKKSAEADVAKSYVILLTCVIYYEMFIISIKKKACVNNFFLFLCGWNDNKDTRLKVITEKEERIHLNLTKHFIIACSNVIVNAKASRQAKCFLDYFNLAVWL